jgi:hypothetical protein
MKLCVSAWPRNCVVKSPYSSRPITVPADLLFDSVSTPKISEPVRVRAPLAATAGSWMTTPLLSVVNAVTGLGTWLASGTMTGWHCVWVQE